MTARLLLVIAAVACTGCGDRRSNAAAELAGNEDPELTGESSEAVIPDGATPEQIVELKAKKYAAGFVADAPAMLGTLAEGARNDHLLVLRAGHCYRIVGAGGDGVEDLDLFLFEPDGVQSQQDPGEDRFPVLGMQSEICPFQGGAYRLQVYMYRGTGGYAVRPYRTP